MRGVMAKKQRHVSEGYETCLNNLRTHIRVMPTEQGMLLVELGSNKQMCFQIAQDAVLAAAEKAVKYGDKIKAEKLKGALDVNRAQTNPQPTGG